MYKIVFKNSAVKEFEKLPYPIQNRIKELCENLRQAGPFKITGLKALQGMKGIYRYRIGKYRVLFHIDSSQSLITIVRISLRDKAYMNL